MEENRRLRWKKGIKKLSMLFDRKMQEVLGQDGFFLLFLLLFSSSSIGMRLNKVYHGMGTAGMVTTFAKMPFHILCGWMECFLLLFLLSYVPKRLRRLLQGGILFFAGFIFFADLFLLYAFGDVLDQAKIETVLGTNPREAFGFIQNYGTQPGILLLLAGLFIFILFVRNCKRKHGISISGWMAGHHVVWSVLAVICFCTFLVGSFKVAVGEYYKNGDWASMRMEPFRTMLYMDNSLARLLLDSYGAYESIGNVNRINQVMAENRENILENNGDIPYVIFVLGESTDRNKMSLYGYRLDTNPLLRERMKTDHMYLYDDTIACDYYTTGAMRKIFTFAGKEDTEPWYTKANLFDILHDAGYQTTWISNQSPVDMYGNMDHLYAEHMDKAQFTAVQGGYGGTVIRHLDEELLPLLDQDLFDDSSDRNFYVLHLYGAHMAYKERYPASFQRFTAADEIGGSTDQQRQMKAEYDNAVLYNDWIMNEIYKRFEQKDAIVIYISDHGEEVYEGRNFAGHSDESHGSVNMIEVPCIFWVSNQFAAKRPELTAKIEAAAHRPYRTDELIHTILDILQIRTKSYDATQSIINDAFREHERIWNGKAYHKEA